jgi:hypothetical protein
MGNEYASPTLFHEAGRFSLCRDCGLPDRLLARMFVIEPSGIVMLAG